MAGAWGIKRCGLDGGDKALAFAFGIGVFCFRGLCILKIDELSFVMFILAPRYFKILRRKHN